MSSNAENLSDATTRPVPPNGPVFVLNGDVIEAAGVPATTTLLDYLRDHLHKTGTKEGCAEGDCGACTVMVSSLGSQHKGGEGSGENPLSQDALAHRPANACLMTVGQAHGLAITTVEGLSNGGRDADAMLHPVQQAMVVGDGAQCGFCTPGIIMSMAAYAKSGGTPDEDVIHDMLAGNLCRCTGYRPIVAACKESLGNLDAAVEAQADVKLTALLRELPSADRLSAFHHAKQTFYAPSTVADVVDLLTKAPDAWLVAGGTDIGLRFSKGREVPDVVIGLSNVSEMRAVVDGADSLSIGAAEPYADVLPVLSTYFPDFANLLRRIGSRQIRTLGTIGGNLVTASPIGDTLPCLMALEAVVTVHGPGGERTLPLTEFITGYRTTDLGLGEVVTRITIPKPGKSHGTHHRFFAYKISKRFDQDISAVVMAAAVEVGAAGSEIVAVRLALGGVGPTTIRATATEAFLTGAPITMERFEAAKAILLEEISPMDDFRASADYRNSVSGNLLLRLYQELVGSDQPARLEAL